MQYFIILILVLAGYAHADDNDIVLGVHSNTAPLEWRANGVDQGFNIELMNRIGQVLGKSIVVRRKSFQQLIDDTQTMDSDIDMIAVVTPINVRRTLSQSDPIYATYAKAYTRQNDDFIENWSDLDGKRVAIKRGSFVDVYLANKPQHFKIVPVDLYETGFQLLGEGLVDVVLAENFVARRLQPDYPQVRSASDPLIFGTYTFVSQRHKIKLMHQVNLALRQLKLSGEYDKLINKWFGTGREKVDISSTQQKMLTWAIIVAIVSIIGMLFTALVSRNLRIRSNALALELQQRKQAEQQILNLSDQFQAVLDGIPHGVTIFNQQMTCLWSNDAQQLFKLDNFVFVNQHPFDIQKTVQQVLDSQQSFIAEMQYDTQFWQIQIHPIAEQQAVVLLEDNTEQHALRQANDQASRLASLGELSAGIAHEINNPTGIIIHSISLFSQSITDLQAAAESYQQQNPFWQIAGLAPQTAFEELNHSAQVVEDSAKRISRIVNDLKRYALPNTNTYHQLADINEVVQVALRLTANQLKRFQVNVTLHPTPLMIKADVQQLHQVLINLIQNAVHACHDATDTIEIATITDTNKVYIKITDTGSGMDNATVARITEPFFTTRRNEGGSGLGLSVSSRILKEHHAHMQVQSSLGQGSCFTLSFARKCSESNMPKSAQRCHSSTFGNP
ncbi:ATP-binding protein [Shewanella intestini]|uniref:histidine kinase n=1 Tax=Shewanella intestini TaxID=2017544 RepID=A0ABS5I6G4_9GAMM|nr:MULTISPECIES: transporter substrate-binding domain-containing protein [Shewanella]MBR9729581.1 transporter substrate-binding domain-containing protein [Shewanella intestini]MRG37651.1 transporter substrate-binding domain-containing protein [Shewanella sp. XMDDZSB0408]